MTLVRTTDNNRFVTTTDWSGYTKFLDAVGEGRTRITYDRGALELLTPSPEHEIMKTLFGALLEGYLEVIELDFVGGGSTTFRQQELDRGLEPDECYWLGDISTILGMTRYDPESHRPPDLALEVEVTRSSLDRIGIYAALGIPEVLRYIPADQTRPHRLQSLELVGGAYRPTEAIQALPRMPFELLLEHLSLGRTQGQRKMMASFRSRLRAGLRTG